jgi:hypothetical protein
MLLRTGRAKSIILRVRTSSVKAGCHLSTLWGSAFNIFFAAVPWGLDIQTRSPEGNIQFYAAVRLVRIGYWLVSVLAPAVRRSAARPVTEDEPLGQAPAIWIQPT